MCGFVHWLRCRQRSPPITEGVSEPQILNRFRASSHKNVCNVSILGLPATALATTQLLELQCSNDHVTMPILSEIMLLLTNMMEGFMAKSQRESPEWFCHTLNANAGDENEY